MPKIGRIDRHSSCMSGSKWRSSDRERSQSKSKRHRRSSSSSDEEKSSHKKKRRKRYSSSSSDTSSSSSSEEDRKRKEERRLKKRKKKLKKKLKKEAKKKRKLEKVKLELEFSKAQEEAKRIKNQETKMAKAAEVQASKKMAPMTKEMWEKQQSVVKRVYDEDTGRTRLIKGDGEIMEEIVSESRHKEINKTATKGDGLSFQSLINNKIGSTS